MRCNKQESKSERPACKCSRRDCQLWFGALTEVCAAADRHQRGQVPKACLCSWHRTQARPPRMQTVNGHCCCAELCVVVCRPSCVQCVWLRSCCQHDGYHWAAPTTRRVGTGAAAAAAVCQRGALCRLADTRHVQRGFIGIVFRLVAACASKDANGMAWLLVCVDCNCSGDCLSLSSLLLALLGAGGSVWVGVSFATSSACPREPHQSLCACTCPQRRRVTSLQQCRPQATSWLQTAGAACPGRHLCRAAAALTLTPPWCGLLGCHRLLQCEGPYINIHSQTRALTGCALYRLPAGCELHHNGRLMSC